ncbi:Eco57I restriction-modification methylase domain-containing protein [Dermabacteraceae bacterium P13138]
MIANSEVLDRIIVGRVTPHIYAFTTNTVPSYLKVGDTYRPVSMRLREWERHFPGLTKQYEAPAVVSGDVYFRDYSIHTFLERDRQRSRLLPGLLPAGTYYSKEFFKDAAPSDVADAISDVQRDFDKQEGRYDFYDATTQLPQPFHYERGEVWALRPNQQEAVDNFVKAVDAGRTSLLMYAVMRFGKSFTSLNCAKAINAKTILIVSAKADVCSEWKKTVETAGNFTNWVFIDEGDLARDDSILDKARESQKTAAIFLTLQDLQGVRLKEKHRQVFTSELDLLIVDETHFGARAEEYGRVLRDAGQVADPTSAQRRDLDDQINIEDADGQLKQIKPRIRLHLSGTPYRILMGSEFQPEDIISFVQFSDIVREQEAWDQENLDNDDIEEWDNPYFGFPQMVRFAFNPNESSRKRMAELRKSGVTFAFSALLEPQSIKLDAETNLHCKFKHEPEILDLLKVIDGSQQDKNVLGFLDYDKIKEGKMCRHVVMVLPYCASCDAMEQLIKDHKEEFKNLGGYKIINISGVEGAKVYKTPEAVKSTITNAEAENQKTLTLTVNRMLTGSTVEQWDTMLYLKDTASPQDYDQAIFRLQNQYTRTLVSAEGKTIKENLKPQTLLVDFDPARMFRMQEQKSLIYNVNTDHSGNDKLEDRLREELRISPIITINHNKIQQVEAASILDAVSAYNNNRSIADEARDIPVDLGLLDNDIIRKVIESQAEIGSRQGLSVNPVEGDEVDLDIEDQDLQNAEDEAKPDKKKPGDRKDDDMRSLEKKLQTYYQRILFFAMLTSDEVSSLADVIDIINREHNTRIANNLGLNAKVLWEMMGVFDPFKLSALDYKIHNISQLGRDESLPPVERATRALAKFSRISDSEVRTPQWLCNDMIELIPGDELAQAVREGQNILDIASKSGEFAIAAYQRLTTQLDVPENEAKNAIYSIPTSSIAYEFTRRFYEILDLNVDNIAQTVNSYNLVDLIYSQKTPKHSDATASVPLIPIKTFSSEHVKGGKAMQFAAVVGNPPYQVSDGGAGASAKPIYSDFVNLAHNLTARFATLVIPSRWYTGGKGLENFRTKMVSNDHVKVLVDFPSPEMVFPGTNNRGGVCYFLLDGKYSASASGGTLIETVSAKGAVSKAKRPLNTFNTGVFLRDSLGVAIVDKVRQHSSFASLSTRISAAKAFGFRTFFINDPSFRASEKGLIKPVACFGRGGRKGYVEESEVPRNTNWIYRWKVFVPESNNIGTELNDDNQNVIIGPPGTICTETYLVVGVDLVHNELEASALASFLKTKFARFLLAQAKVSQHGTKQTYRFVPTPELSASSQIKWNLPLCSIDEQLFDFYGLSEGEKTHVLASIKDMI